MNQPTFVTTILQARWVNLHCCLSAHGFYTCFVWMYTRGFWLDTTVQFDSTCFHTSMSLLAHSKASLMFGKHMNANRWERLQLQNASLSLCPCCLFILALAWPTGPWENTRAFKKRKSQMRIDSWFERELGPPNSHDNDDEWLVAWRNCDLDENQWLPFIPVWRETPQKWCAF